MFKYTEFLDTLVTATAHFKDTRLDELADQGNVAQFVSFSPSLTLRFSRVSGFKPNYPFESVVDAIQALLEASPERKVNLRSFDPVNPQGNDFLYGLESVAEVASQARQLAEKGLHVIVNETVDVEDGGVSGVSHAGIVEFAPGVTPRVVEQGGIVSVSRDLAFKMLSAVYGFVPELPTNPELRVEFSIHPVERGYYHKRTIIWEVQTVPTTLTPSLQWPNRFSRFIGDKAFGLLVAHCLGLPVPFTTVIARAVPPFSFGRHTGSSEKWIRTCPMEAEPGLFPTIRGWVDPFKLMKDTAGSDRIASVILQDEVESRFSGALLSGADGQAIIEGVRGFGDDLMLGKTSPEVLEAHLHNTIEDLHKHIERSIGSVRAEWATDNANTWILQLQQEAAVSAGLVIVPGTVREEVSFDTTKGIAGLRELVQLLRGRDIGIALSGNVGMTSHIADILRREQIPSRIVPISKTVKTSGLFDE